jgi:RNA polymerase sigma-70 factor (ECF subfamily)
MNGADHSTRLNAYGGERVVAQEKETVSATPAGSPEAFAEFYALYSRRLYRTIIAITKHSQDAEDALQETFLRAYLSFHTFEGRSNVYSWLTRIAINSALMVLRKRRARPEILFDPQPDSHAEAFGFEIQDSSPSPEKFCDLRHRHFTLLGAIHNLDVKLRRPLQMRMTKESSMKDISRALNISEAAVKTRLHRARLRLSALYREP